MNDGGETRRDGGITAAKDVILALAWGLFTNLTVNGFKGIPPLEVGYFNEELAH